MTDVTWLDATAQADLVRRGEASPAELVDAAITRIEALNPRLDAVIRARFDHARAQAAGTLPDGPFRGVPILLKDLGCLVAGEVTAFGLGPLKDVAWPVTSYLAGQFLAAGFVPLGRTNVPEMGTTVTTEPRSFPRRATRGIPVIRPAARPEGRRPRWRPAWCRSRTPTTAAAPFASRPANAGWSGSSRPAGG